MKLIDADAIPWLLDYKYPHVEGFQTVTKIAIDNMHTVEAIPLWWLSELSNKLVEINQIEVSKAIDVIVAVWRKEE